MGVNEVVGATPEDDVIDWDPGHPATPADAVPDGGPGPTDAGADADAGDADTADADANVEPDAAAVRRLWSGRAALVAFAAYLLVAFVWLVASFGDKYWFIGDEWGFLVERSLTDPVGWFTPQNTHWSTVPIAIYLGLFKVFGLQSYVPYMATVIVAHLLLATLLRVVMRRAGVGPWIATIVAGTFVLYGTGQQNILFGVQVSMVASMVCGVGHLILADHDGPFDRRDALGLAVGAIGLMASGVAPPLVIVVGVAVLLRRGWRMAALHTAPLALLYVIWTVWQRPFDQTAAEPATHIPTILDFVRTGLVGVFRGLGQYDPVALALAAVLVVGLVVAWRPLTRSELRRRAAAPLALLLGAVFLLGVAGSQRYLLGADAALASRYVSMGTALVLPALGVAAGAIAARWRVAGPIVLLLLLIGVPGNIAAFQPDDGGQRWATYQAQREFILGSLASPLADEVSTDVRPYPGEFNADEVTLGFLIAARATGKVPDPPPLSDKVREKIDTRLSLSQSDPIDDLPGAVCTPQFEPLVIEPELGERFAIKGPVSIARGVPGTDGYAGVTTYSPSWNGHVLTAQLPDQRFRISPVPPATMFDWCTEP